MKKYKRYCKYCNILYNASSKLGKVCDKCNIFKKNHILSKKEKKKMTTIKEEAQEYEPKQIRNIAELEKISINLELETRTYKEGTEDEYKIKVCVIDNVVYRIPNIVLGQLKEQLKENSDLNFFKVKKTGQGKEGTNYTVIPLIR